MWEDAAESEDLDQADDDLDNDENDDDPLEKDAVLALVLVPQHVQHRLQDLKPSVQDLHPVVDLQVLKNVLVEGAQSIASVLSRAVRE